ncbi:MAG: hypothetical protein RIG82_11805 [Phycisphaeraceae bacterium]
MPGRSSNKTPFEVMGRRDAGPEPSPQPSEAPKAADRPAADSEPTTDLLAPSEPLVLRVPKGLVAAVAVVLLLILGLAYWVGYERGANGETETTAAAVEAPPGPLTTPAAPPRFIGADLEGPGISLLDLSRTPLGGYQADSPSDPRQDGMNYLILATYPAAEAQRLSEFLVTHRVASVLKPVNNDRFQVIAVNVGFTRDAFEQGTQETYRQALLEVGRAWHAHNGRRGNDALQDMYFYRHGPTP